MHFYSDRRENDNLHQIGVALWNRIVIALAFPAKKPEPWFLESADGSRHTLLSAIDFVEREFTNSIEFTFLWFNFSIMWEANR